MANLFTCSNDILLWTAKFGGFLPLNWPEERRTSSSSILTTVIRFSQRILLFCIILASLGSVAYLSAVHLSVLNQLGRPVTSYLVLTGYFLATFGFCLLVIAFAFLRAPKLTVLWEELSEASTRLGFRESEYRQIHRRNSIFTWIVIVLTWVHATLSACLGESWLYKFDWPLESWQKIPVLLSRLTYIYPYMFTALVLQMSYAMEKVLLKHKMVVAHFFNLNLESCNEEFGFVSNVKLEMRGAANELDRLRRLHLELVNLAISVQNHFAFPILFQVLLTICGLTSGTVLFLIRTLNKAYFTYPQLILETGMALARLILVVRAGDGVADKMVCVKEELENVSSSKLSIPLQLQLQQFLSKVQSEQVAWSALGFFKIQGNLVPSVLGSMLTYFLIFYQYHVYANKGSLW